MKQSFLILYQPASVQPPAGPFDGDTGEVIVLAPDRALIEIDPAVAQGAFTYELHPWALVSRYTYATTGLTKRHVN